MPRTCTICAHPQRQAIDRALVAGEAFRHIAERYDVALASLSRHRQEHVAAAVARAREADEAARGLDVLAQLEAINEASRAVLAAARKAQDGDLALKACDRVLRQIELQAKLLGDLDERPVVNVLVSPEWLALRGQLLAALAPYPDARAAVAGALQC